MIDMTNLDKLTNLDMRLVGVPYHLNPFANHASSQRLAMFVQHISSSQVPRHAETPRTFTGFDVKMGDYVRNPLKFDDDIRILGIILKYRDLPIDKNPYAVVIYESQSTGIIDLTIVNRIENPSGSYAYETTFENLSMLSSENSMIYSGMEVVVPRNKSIGSGEYSQSVNANTVFMSTMDTHEDAMVISESFAKKLELTKLDTVTISIGKGQQGLNLYGSDEFYKIIPDVGETIPESGILAAVRKLGADNVVTEFNKHDIKKPNSLHDRIYYAHPGGVITDIEVVSNNDITHQLMQQYACRVAEFNDVMMLVSKLDVSKFGNRLTTYLTKASKYLNKEGINRMQKAVKSRFVSKGVPIDTVIKVSYTYNQIAKSGTKITGRDGSKGIVSEVRPDRYMPVDEDGVRADVIADTASIIKRTILSTLFEIFNSAFMDQVIHESSGRSVEERYDIIMEMVKFISPVYGDMLLNAYPDKTEFIEEVDERNLNVMLLAGDPRINMNFINEAVKKYNLKHKAVTIYTKQLDGSYNKELLKSKTIIASKAMYVLYNEPPVTSIATTSLSILGIPSKTKKSTNVNVSYKSTRTQGEDEIRLLYSSVADSEVVSRLHLLQSSSEEGIKQLVKSILTADNVAKVKVDISTDRLKKTSKILDFAHEILNLTGEDLRDAREEIV